MGWWGRFCISTTGTCSEGKKPGQAKGKNEGKEKAECVKNEEAETKARNRERRRVAMLNWSWRGSGPRGSTRLDRAVSDMCPLAHEVLPNNQL